MISHKGMILFFHKIKKINSPLTNRSANLTTITFHHHSNHHFCLAQPQLLRSMEECTVLLQCLIHINNPVNQKFVADNPKVNHPRTPFQEFLAFWGWLLLAKLIERTHWCHHHGPFSCKNSAQAGSVWEWLSGLLDGFDSHKIESKFSASKILSNRMHFLSTKYCNPPAFSISPPPFSPPPPCLPTYTPPTSS